MPSAANTQARHQAQGSVTGNGFRLEAIQGVRTWRPFSSGSCDLILGPPARVHLDEFTAGKPWATNTPLPHNSATSLPPLLSLPPRDNGRAFATLTYSLSHAHTLSLNQAIQHLRWAHARTHTAKGADYVVRMFKCECPTMRARADKK